MNKLLCLLTFLTLLIQSNVSAQVYAFAELKDGIERFERREEPNDYLWTKLVTIINVPIDEVTDFTKRIDKLMNWVYACEETRLIEDNGEDVVYYIVTAMPFPMTNRDAVIKKKITKDSLTGIIHSISETYDQYEYESELVRIPRFKAIWVFEPLENGQTKISYEFSADPGGSIPEWLKVKYASHGPMKSLENLIQVLGNNGD